MDGQLQKVAGRFWLDHEPDNSKIRGLFDGRTLNDAALRRCLTRACVDITARTLAVDAHPEAAPSAQVPEARVTERLVAAFWDANIYDLFDRWFRPLAQPEAPLPDFDVWHHEACQLILAVLQATRYPTAGYGKAQKVINMTFKTMYALVAAYPPDFDVEAFFKPCHMPLDSFTLEWFHSIKYTNNGRKNVLRPNPGRTRSVGGAPAPDPGYYAASRTEWSNIQWSMGLQTQAHYIGTGKDAKYSYQFYVDEIRSLFEEHADPQYGSVEQQYATYTPLQAEFFIWDKMQYIRAARYLAAALEDFCGKYPEIQAVATDHIQTNPDLQANIHRIKAALSRLQGGSCCP